MPQSKQSATVRLRPCHTTWRFAGAVFSLSLLAIGLLAPLNQRGPSDLPAGGATTNRSWSGPGVAEAATEDAPPPKAVLVRLRPGAAVSGARDFGNGVRTVRAVPGSRWQRLELEPAESAASKAAQLRGQPGIEQAVPDYYRRLAFQPNDEYFKLQWNFEQIQVTQAWDLSRGDGITVAILDTGLHLGGVDDPERVLPGYNFFDGTTNTDDEHGHGTHIAGTIAQRTNNSSGVTGIAPKANILPLKICDVSGLCPDSSIIAAIAYARERGANVINLSLGGPDLSPALSEAVADAIASNVVVVAAIGNSGVANYAYYPAALPGVIAVGASRYDKTRASYSNYGRSLWLLAPGGDVRVDQNGDGYGDGIPQQTLGRSCGQSTEFGYCFYQGTSMATPHVAGTAALMLAVNKGLTPKQVMTMLAVSAMDLGTCGWDSETGYGILQAYNAVALAAGISPNVTTPSQNPQCPQSPLVTPERWFVQAAPAGYQGWSQAP